MTDDVIVIGQENEIGKPGSNYFKKTMLLVINALEKVMNATFFWRCGVLFHLRQL